MKEKCLMIFDKYINLFAFDIFSKGPFFADNFMCVKISGNEFSIVSLTGSELDMTTSYNIDVLI